MEFCDEIAYSIVVLQGMGNNPRIISLSSRKESAKRIKMSSDLQSEQAKTSIYYQTVLKQPLVPMTLRVGCINIQSNSQFDFYGKGDGQLKKLLLEIDSSMQKLSRNPVAAQIYSDEKPIIRFMSKKDIELSDFKNVQVENTRFFSMVDSDRDSPISLDTSAILSDETQPSNSFKKNYLCYSTQVTGSESNAEFIVKQIALHSDLLLIDGSVSSQLEVDEFLDSYSEEIEPKYIIVIRSGGTAEFIEANQTRTIQYLAWKELTDKLESALREMLLFDSLLKEFKNEILSGKDNKENAAIQRVVDYAGEKAVCYQNIAADFEYQGPIGSQASLFSWHNLFRRFVSMLSPKKANGKPSEPANTIEEGHQRNLDLQNKSKNCHRLFAHFLRADHLAVRYANAHRSSFILIYCLGAFALINAAIAIGFSQIGWLALTSALAEFFALVGIFLIYRNDHKKRYHIKWLEYRSLAEMLRMAPLLNSLGIAQSARGFERHRKDNDSDRVTAHNAGRTWLIIYTETLMRRIDFDQVKINKDSIVSAKSFLRETILKSQIRYHESNAHKMHVVGHNLGHFSYVLFVLAFIFVSGKLLTKLLAAMHLGIDYQMLSHIGHGLGFLAAVCPMLGSAAFAIRNHAEFDISSQRSIEMLKNLKQDVNTLDKMKDSVGYQQLIDQTLKTSLTMQSETADWLEIYEVKETEPG